MSQTRPERARRCGSVSGRLTRPPARRSGPPAGGAGWRSRAAIMSFMVNPADVPVVALTTGAQMPMIGFGSWPLRGDQARDAILVALEAGYRHIDTATAYENEEPIGAAIRASGLPRSELFITTKLREGDVGREAETLRESLRLLGTDYLDLWLHHGPAQPAENRQVWAAMIKLQAAGHVRDIGVSNYSTAELDEVTQSSGQAPAVNQVLWNPGCYDRVVLEDHAERGIAFEGYSALRHTNLDDPVLTRIAAAHGVTAAQIVLRWHLEHDVTVIPRSGQPDRIAANIDLLGFALTPEQTAAIDGLARGS
jgi:2,5-diketo-D-gluconate reductase A